jgi:hypothetical protein
LQRTYEVSQEHHDPSVGHDNLSFGTLVWRSGNFFLSAAVKAMGGSAEVINQSLQMRFGDVELRHHKLGISEEDDFWHSFPNHPGPAARMLGRSANVQLELQLPEEEIREFFDWVLGSYGNPEDGLRAVVLHAVGGSRALDGTISRWEAVIPLFDARVGAALPVSAVSLERPVAAEVEVAPEPGVELHSEAHPHEGQ